MYASTVSRLNDGLSAHESPYGRVHVASPTVVRGFGELEDEAALFGESYGVEDFSAPASMPEDIAAVFEEIPRERLATDLSVTRDEGDREIPTVDDAPTFALPVAFPILIAGPAPVDQYDEPYVRPDPIGLPLDPAYEPVASLPPDPSPVPANIPASIPASTPEPLSLTEIIETFFGPVETVSEPVQVTDMSVVRDEPAYQPVYSVDAATDEPIAVPMVTARPIDMPVLIASPVVPVEESDPVILSYPGNEPIDNGDVPVETVPVIVAQTPSGPIYRDVPVPVFVPGPVFTSPRSGGVTTASFADAMFSPLGIAIALAAYFAVVEKRFTGAPVRRRSTRSRRRK